MWAISTRLLRYKRGVQAFGFGTCLTMEAKVYLLVLLSLISIHSEANPAGDSLRARLGDTISELEWLLHQLVNILSDMVDGIEQEPSLLQNYHFRQILIQVIKRIDLILEHFENVGMAVLTPTVVYELQRIDCIRIRLANYISQSKKFNDSHCRGTGGSHKPGNQPPNTDQIVPLLTQIISILVKVTQQLDHLTNMKDLMPSTGKPVSTTVTAPPIWSKPGSTINWDDLISGFVTTSPTVTVPNTAATQTSGIGTTQNWNDLISQVMEGMGGTLTPTTSATSLSTATSASTVWEDVMNDLLGQWTGSMSTKPPGSSMDVQQCVDSILSIINNIQNQLPNATMPSRPT